VPILHLENHLILRKFDPMTHSTIEHRLSTDRVPTMKLKRLIIYPKDIMLITGKSERYSRYLHKRIKKQLGKEDHQVISVNEFCNYMGLDSNEIQEVII
jgi:hypothetical protein